MNFLLFLLFINFYLGCTLLPSTNNLTKKQKGLPQIYTITPGTFVRMTLPVKNVHNVANLVCKKKIIPYYKLENTLMAYLAEEHDSTRTGYNCYYQHKNRMKKKLIAKIKIIPKKYPHRNIYVDPNMVFLSIKNQKRVALDKQKLIKIYNKSNQVPYSNDYFIYPVNTFITSEFGINRLFNEKKKSVHFGIDFAGNSSDLISAALNGRVVFSSELFYTGKTIIIDHGIGLFTLYGHLSKYLKHVGDIVKQGEKIGAIGSTGRVTGPHLHWGTIVHGLWSDGNSLISPLK